MQIIGHQFKLVLLIRPLTKIKETYTKLNRFITENIQWYTMNREDDFNGEQTFPPTSPPQIRRSRHTNFHLFLEPPRPLLAFLSNNLQYSQIEISYIDVFSAQNCQSKKICGGMSVHRF